MEGWKIDFWDVVILLAGGYVAWMTLVRLMARRHAQLVESIRSQVQQPAADSPEEPAAKA
ncbi:MAG: hypothetical protein AAGA92_06060 [Planctomycetota bacterium]